MKIKCIGQFTIDDIVLPDGTVKMGTMGGNALYSAAGAKLWVQAGSAAPVACAGRDYPPVFLEYLAEQNLDLSHVRRTEHSHMRSWVLYEENRERRCLCRNSAVLPYPPISEESFHLYFEAYQQVHLENSPLLELSPGDLQADAYHLAPQSFERHMANLRAIRAAAPHALVSLDPSPFYMRPGGREQLAAVLALTDIVLPSLEEISSCFGPVSPEAAAETILALGPSVVAVKMGAAGVYVRERTRGEGMRIPAWQGTVTDTTGAGDAFCGGFLAGYLAERDAGYAACCGAVSSSYAIADYGPRSLLEAGPGEARSRRDALLEQIGKQLRTPKNREE